MYALCKTYKRLPQILSLESCLLQTTKTPKAKACMRDLETEAFTLLPEMCIFFLIIPSTHNYCKDISHLKRAIWTSPDHLASFLFTQNQMQPFQLCRPSMWLVNLALKVC